MPVFPVASSLHVRIPQRGVRTHRSSTRISMVASLTAVAALLSLLSPVWGFVRPHVGGSLQVRIIPKNRCSCVYHVASSSCKFSAEWLLCVCTLARSGLRGRGWSGLRLQDQAAESPLPCEAGGGQKEEKLEHTFPEEPHYHCRQARLGDRPKRPSSVAVGCCIPQHSTRRVCFPCAVIVGLL